MTTSEGLERVAAGLVGKPRIKMRGVVAIVVKRSHCNVKAMQWLVL